MSIVFIAVQCFQCDTMQVKQEKKSSNKWTCVVCNEKQSRMKVFGRGYKAKELREFVQSFNMSRGLAADEQDSAADDENLTPVPAVDFSDGREQRKRRTDWSEYLDSQDNQYQKGTKKQVDEGDDDSGIRIVTEMPKEMFKRPKLKNYVDVSGACGGGNSYRPIFSKRNANRHDISPGEEEYKLSTRGKSVSSTRRNRDYQTRGDTNKELDFTTYQTASKGSKWKEYMVEDDNNMGFVFGKNLDHATEENLDVWEALCDDQKVEDDIHPDFM